MRRARHSRCHAFDCNLIWRAMRSSVRRANEGEKIVTLG
ncbi:MAG: hypothetical protein ACLUD2_12010 [Clostridium sp.]